MIVHHRHQFQNALTHGPVSILSRLQARPVLDQRGDPIVIEGERSLVAKVETRDGRTLALMVARDDGGDPYADRAAGLRRLALTRLGAHLPPGFDHLRDGVEINGKSLSVTVCEWVNGPSLLDAAMRLASEGNARVLRALAMSVSRALNDLRMASFAHDMLNPGNALVGSNGALVFTGLSRATWDGGASPSSAIAVNAWRHPDGDGDPFAEDVYAAMTLYASLLVLADVPTMLSSEQGRVDTRPLIFSKRDLADPHASPIFARALAQTSAETREVVEALRSASVSPVSEIDRWASVMPGFQRVEIPEFLKKRPSTTRTRQAPSVDREQWVGDTKGVDRPSWPTPSESGPWATWQGVESPDRGLPADQGVADGLWPELPPERLSRQSQATPPPSPRVDRARRDVRPSQHDPEDVSPDTRPPDMAVEQRRKAFFAALSARDEATVRALWDELADDPVVRTAAMPVQDLVGRALRERIRTEQRSGRPERAVHLAAMAAASGVPIEPEVRQRLRAYDHRAATRDRLEQALSANDLDQLAELAVSGELLDLDDTDRQTVQRVMRSLRWPSLASALATDDDQIIVDAFDGELWENGRALSTQARARIGQAMARIDWRDRVRQSLKARDAEALETLFRDSPTSALDRLSASERRRSRRLIEQRRALADLQTAVSRLDDDAIVRALQQVERVGARIHDRSTWVAIQRIVERTSLIEDLMRAVDASPMDVGKLAHLVPAVRTMGYDRDSRLQGSYALDRLEHTLVQHAHVRRVRAALEKGDNAAIVLVAIPDTYGALDLLSESERSQVAQAIHDQRRVNRAGVTARFRTPVMMES